MTQKLWTVLAALAVGACATGSRSDAPQPVVAPLHSDFSQSDDGASVYGPFVAATLAQQGDEHSRAARYYLEALKVDPTSRFVADRAFFQLLYAGRIEEAADVATTILQGKDEGLNDLPHLARVLQAFKAGNWAEVRERLKTQPKVGFGFLLAPLLNAWTYAAQGDEQHARDALMAVLKDPRLKPIGEEHLAYILDALGRFDKAGSRYRALLAGDRANSVQVMSAYAYMLYREGKKDEARAFLSEQTKRHPSSQLLLRDAVSILSGGTPSQVSASPVGAATSMFVQLASEFSHSRSPKAAIIYLRLASYLSPGVAEISVMLGDLFQEVGNPAAAVAAYATVAPDSSLKPLADIRRVQALESAGQSAEAENETRDLLRQNPGNGTLLTLLANLLRARDDFAEAATHYSTVIAHLKRPDAGDWFLYFSRGVCYERLGDWEKAEADMQTALRLNPGEANVLNYLGYSWIDRGVNVPEAMKLIAKAASERPNDGFIVDSYGWVHFLTGDYAKAVELLEKAVRLEPDDATINDHLGDAYWRVGRKLEARFQWRHALSGKPDEKEAKELHEKLAFGLPDKSADSAQP